MKLQYNYIVTIFYIMLSNINVIKIYVYVTFHRLEGTLFDIPEWLGIGRNERVCEIKVGARAGVGKLRSAGHSRTLYNV